MERSEIQIRILEKGEITCADFSDLLYDYTESELLDSLKERLDSHLSECCACKCKADEYKKIISLARELRIHKELPSDVRERLHAALNNRLGLELRA